ncbi:MAG TPA: DUF3857 domain-containing protein, partial [Dinghuibacter sp.]|uniref:DUF3857 domain-containing protein n=1 Tax=Dinghuibacter sp. TaxID=2024697 RepID=UPI002CBA3430
MRKLFALTLALLAGHVSYGQKDLPSYGKIDKDDLTSTSCDFDPESDACILIKTGETKFTLAGEETSYRLRIKIYQDKGVDRANVTIPFISENNIEGINGVSGETYNLDAGGNIVKTKLDQAAIFTKPINKSYSLVAFSLPDVKKGSVIEYKYTKVSRHNGYIDNWYFQEEACPVRFCQYFVAVPAALGFNYNVRHSLPLDEKEDPYNAGQRTFTMKNIPALREEPYMSAPQDYLQRIEFQLSVVLEGGADQAYQRTENHSYRNTWSELCKEIMADDDFGAQLHKNVPHTKELDSTLASLQDSLSRMGAVYNYVRGHMEWNGYEGLYAQTGVKTAWDKGTGNTGDINLLLINLLRDAGLDARVLLVSTRAHGHTNRNNPFLRQFNEAMAYVVIGGDSYVLDATDKYTPFWMIPVDVQYTQGLLVDPNDPQWVELYHPKDRFKTVVVLNGNIDSLGTLQGEAAVSSYGYSRCDRSAALASGMAHYRETYFTNPYPGIHVDSLTIEGRDDDSLPLKQILGFSQRLNTSGSYTFMTPNLFLGLDKNPFVAERRFTDVDFESTRSFVIIGTVGLPNGFTPEKLPKNMRMRMPDTSIVLERLMEIDGGRLSY